MPEYVQAEKRTMKEGDYHALLALLLLMATIVVLCVATPILLPVDAKPYLVMAAIGAPSTLGLWAVLVYNQPRTIASRRRVIRRPSMRYYSGR